MWPFSAREKFIPREYPGRYYAAKVCPEKHISSVTAVFCETCGNSLLMSRPVRNVFQTNDFEYEWGDNAIRTEILET